MNKLLSDLDLLLHSMRGRVDGYTPDEVRQMCREFVIVGEGLAVNRAVACGLMTEELWLEFVEEGQEHG